MLLGHRYYDPTLGRFLSRDPIGDGRNWYVYGYKQVVVEPEDLVKAPAGLELSEKELSDLESEAREFAIGYGAAVLGGAALIAGPDPITRGAGLAGLGTGSHMMDNALRKANMRLRDKLDKHKRRMLIALARMKKNENDRPVAIPVEITSLSPNSGTPVPPPFLDPNLHPIFRNPSGFPFPKDPSEFLGPFRPPYIWPGPLPR